MLSIENLYIQNDNIAHKNPKLMNTFIINTAVLTLCHSDIFQPSNGHQI